MNYHCKEYYWKEGIPQCWMRVELSEAATLPLTYKIVIDPYYRRISIENYTHAHFVAVIYDSALLDFRKLHPDNQVGWQKEMLSEAPQEIVSLIRDHEDRVILFETQKFQDNWCRECCLSSPQGTLISIHKMYYTKQGDSFDGVGLFDANAHPVIQKNYAINEKGEFTHLISEKRKWEIGIA